MTAPQRIQRRRTKGWRMPPNTVYVGRGSHYGNQWTVGLARCGCRSAGECSHNAFRVETAAEAVEQYRWWVTQWSSSALDLMRSELRGKNLACWCPPGQPCHADVLLELANA